MSLTKISNKKITTKAGRKVANSMSEVGKVQDERGTSFMQKSYRNNLRIKKPDGSRL